MCGIAGIWGERAPADAEARVKAMLSAMRHRGPDGSRSSGFSGGAVGMVRLALVDLSDKGMQPIWSADRQVAIVFNGEMYNHHVERRRLEQAGYTFRSHSDTEVVLALYLTHGERFVERVRGMFALAIVDFRAQRDGVPRLVLARDPFGIKPLYLATSAQGALVFSSELRALAASGAVNLAVSPEGLADYLTFGFVLQPRTIFEGVKMIEAGTVQTYEAGKDPRSGRFWLMPPPSDSGETFTEAAARLRHVLEESVRIHALADTPVGAFLSGGIDSSITVGLMARHNPKLRTYTVRLTDPELDESAHASAFAKALNCVHTEVEVSNDELPQLLPAFAAALDQPSTDGLNTWLVSRAAGKDVKGVISGLGGDEWFAGYPVVQRMVSLEDRPALRLAGRVAQRAWVPLPARLEHLRRRLASRASPLSMWCAAHRVFSDADVESLLGTARPAAEAVLEQTLRGRLTQAGPVDQACELDVWAYMGCQLLRDSDVTSMASSLELRVPLVDVEVAAAARSIRPDHKVDAGAVPPGKRVLIEAAKDLLPADASSRPKRGFALPYEKWLHGALAPVVRDTTESLERRGLLRTLPERPTATQSWALMILELWLREVATLDRSARGSQRAA